MELCPGFERVWRFRSKPCLNAECDRRACTKHQFHICKNCLPKIENGPMKLVHRPRGNRKYHCMHKKGVDTGKCLGIASVIQTVNLWLSVDWVSSWIVQLVLISSSRKTSRILHLYLIGNMSDVIASFYCTTVSKTGAVVEIINILSLKNGA